MLCWFVSVPLWIHQPVDKSKYILKKYLRGRVNINALLILTIQNDLHTVWRLFVSADYLPLQSPEGSGVPRVSNFNQSICGYTHQVHCVTTTRVLKNNHTDFCALVHVTFAGYVSLFYTVFWFIQCKSTGVLETVTSSGHIEHTGHTVPWKICISESLQDCAFSQILSVSSSYNTRLPGKQLREGCANI